MTEDPIYFHCYLVVCGAINKLSWSLCILQPMLFCVWLHIMPYTCTLCIGYLFKNNCNCTIAHAIAVAVMHRLLTVNSFAPIWVRQSQCTVGIKYNIYPFSLISCCVALQRPCNTMMSPFWPAIMLFSTSAAMWLTITCCTQHWGLPFSCYHRNIFYALHCKGVCPKDYSTICLSGIVQTSD